MKRAVHILALLLIPAAAVAVIEEEEVDEIVAGKYAQFNRALVGRDLAAFTALCTSDCKIQMRPGGARVSLDQFKKLREQGFRTAAITRARTIVDSVEVSGDRARVMATWIGDISARSGSGSRMYRTVQKLEDHWVNADSDWRLRSSIVRSTHTAPLRPPSARR